MNPSLTDLFIQDSLTIPKHELTLRACRASGPGGQHVNKSNTKVQVMWNPLKSTVLDDEQKARIQTKLAHRLNRLGVLTCSSDQYRSQHRNIEAACQILKSLLIRALHVPKPRKATKPSRSQKEKRLRHKKQRSQLKNQRQKKNWD